MTEIRATESSEKRQIDMPIDRLSALPDSMLLHILSFLGVQKAAITSVLSKKWQFLWADLPILEFQECFGPEKPRRYVDSVHRTFDLRSSNAIEKFEIHLSYSNCFASDVNAWIEICLNNKVKNIVLEFNFSKDNYILPEMMYSASSLTCLTVRGCVMSPQRAIEWRSLTKLHLDNVELSHHLFEKILLGCPVLYHLVIEACWGYDRFEVNSRSLHTLEIMECRGRGFNSLVAISAPCLHCLEISVFAGSKMFQLTDISSLASFSISYMGDWDPDVEPLMMSYAKELFGSIQHVKKIELGDRFTSLLSLSMMDGWQLPQTGRECLIVDAKDNGDIAVIVDLLETSPNLETLVIKSWFPYQRPVVHPPESYLKKGDLSCDFLQDS